MLCDSPADDIYRSNCPGRRMRATEPTFSPALVWLAETRGPNGEQAGAHGSPLIVKEQDNVYNLGISKTGLRLFEYHPVTECWLERPKKHTQNEQLFRSSCPSFLTL